MRLIGIDPGVATGYAERDLLENKLLAIEGMTQYECQRRILAIRDSGLPLLVIFEDARMARIFSGKTFGQVNRLQGVGSVKRDSKLWEEFLTAERIPFTTAKPRRRATKKGKGAAELFRTITGWTGKTNQHGRDAAMLIQGLNLSMAKALLRESEQRSRSKS